MYIHKHEHLLTKLIFLCLKNITRYVVTIITQPPPCRRATVNHTTAAIYVQFNIILIYIAVHTIYYINNLVRLHNIACFEIPLPV